MPSFSPSVQDGLPLRIVGTKILHKAVTVRDRILN